MSATLIEQICDVMNGVHRPAAVAAEIKAEQDDAVFLAGVRKSVIAALQGIELGGDE